MPNRVLRDWTDSEPIEKLSWEAEVFYVRLLMKADDLGYYVANPKLLKAALFPLRESVSIQSIENYLNECEDAGLLITYTHEQKKYLHIPKFGQRKRIMSSKYPRYEGESFIDNEANEMAVLTENKPQNLIEFFFNDFPNSSELERISRVLNVPKDKLLLYLPDFKKAASLSYPNTLKFGEHFKNWYLKNRDVLSQNGVKKRNTIT